MVTKTFRITAIQAEPYSVHDDRTPFAEQVRTDLAAHPGTRMIVYPELHLFHSGLEDDATRNAALRSSALDLDLDLDGDFVSWLGNIARENGVWLIPGSLVEKTGTDAIYNTALVFNPEGVVAARYRKMFPWRPYEPYTPGTEFTVFDIEGVGRFGLTICYDAWFPEVTRGLGWLGADLILNLVKTTTPDRKQELVLARANSIVNQTYTVSVNTAGPVGMGQSITVDPEGDVLGELPDNAPGSLTVDFDSRRIETVRRNGTAGINRMWEQFHDGDPIIPLPLYDGRIDPSTWKPQRFTTNKGEKA